MIAQAMRSANAPVRIPINLEPQLHTTTSNPVVTTSVIVKHLSNYGCQRRPSNVVTTPRSPKIQTVVSGNCLYFLTRGNEDGGSRNWRQ